MSVDRVSPSGLRLPDVPYFASHLVASSRVSNAKGSSPGNAASIFLLMSAEIPDGPRHKRHFLTQ